MGFYQFIRKQTFDTSIEKIWDFIADPKNLKHITPDYMGFEIISKSLPEKMYEGMIIRYKVSPLFRIKTSWVTEITHVNEHQYFVDEQRLGPYKIWHHQHLLEKTEEGIEMTDIVSYKPPFGFLGSIANTLIIERKLKEIFDYREQALADIFSITKPIEALPELKI